METKLQSKQQYPRFIQNKPCGIDKFDGGSQERLAKTIARHFVRMIHWMRNVLYLELSASKVFGDLENPTWLKCWNVNYQTTITFEYDAWGHQEDLQRRSILELLTSKLIDDGILSGNATIKVKGGGTKTVSWSEKLKYLLARKRRP